LRRFESNLKDFRQKQEGFGKMAGIIGLTETGKQIDLFVAGLADKKMARRVLRFITTFTREVRKLHLSVRDNAMLLTVLQRHFLCEATARFGALTPHQQNLIDLYVYELTRPGFQPSTKTQVALRRKAATAAVAATAATARAFTA
jgi:hypothetical protein